MWVLEQRRSPSPWGSLPCGPCRRHFWVARPPHRVPCNPPGQLLVNFNLNRITRLLHKEGGDLVLLLWSQLVINFLRKPLSAVVGQVWPDELLLGEAEDTKTTALQCVVNYVARVRHDFRSLKDPARRMWSYIWYPCIHLSLMRPILGRWMSNQR